MIFRYLFEPIDYMSIGQYISQTDLATLAIASNITYGTAIFERRAVEIIDQQVDTVDAWTGGLTGSVREGGGTRRRVQLKMENNQLAWHCSGNPKNHQIFCKHCVAVAMYLRSSPY